MNTLLIRAEANNRIGYGHIMRCLALAQAWQSRGGTVCFVSESLEPALKDMLKREKINIRQSSAPTGSRQDARRLKDLAQQMNADWIVIDGYQFGLEFHKIAKSSGLNLLVIDDIADLDHYCADVILNQNLHAQGNMYENRDSNTRLLLGNRFVLLRKGFWKWRDWKRIIKAKPGRILITLGGGDSSRAILKVLAALQSIESPEIEIVIVVGGGGSGYEKIKSNVEKAGKKYQLKRNVANIQDLMAWADVAISGAGTTSWEMAFMGLPSILTVLGENQRPVAERLEAEGAAVNLGWNEDLAADEIAAVLEKLMRDIDRRREMSRKGRRLIDGEGNQRVLMHLEGAKIRLTGVKPGDRRLIWKWANEPDTRKASFSSSPIPWEDHKVWFDSKLDDPKCFFRVAVDADDREIGQVRIDQENGKALISVSVDRRQRQKGYGTQLIEIASAEFARSCRVRVVNAYVKKTNPASLQAFLKAGYKNIGPVAVKGQAAYRLTWKNSAN